MVAALVVDLRMISQLVDATPHSSLFTLHSSLFTLWVSNETEAGGASLEGVLHHLGRHGEFRHPLSRSRNEVRDLPGCANISALRSIATRLAPQSTSRRIQPFNSTDRLTVAARVESALCKAVRAAATPLQGRRSFGATVDRVLHFGATVGTAIQSFNRRFLAL
jgi:hypothetical protein